MYDNNFSCFLLLVLCRSEISGVAMFQGTTLTNDTNLFHHFNKRINVLLEKKKPRIINLQ